MGAWGYPAAPPYNGLKMFECVDRPGRLSLNPSLPTMYRIGCTMTGGSSGGGWFRVVGGKTELVSNTSIGPAGNTWLAGPQLGRGAQALCENMSKRYGGRSAPCSPGHGEGPPPARGCGPSYVVPAEAGG